MSAENPFPGLRPFEFHENYLFFGREGQTDELLGRLRQHRFLAVVGTSGSGKSSLVRAGLLPDIYGGLMATAGSSWRVALFKPGNDPIGNLAQSLSEPGAFGPAAESGATRPILESTLRRSALGLIELVRQERAGGNLLVVADQFEEVFRFPQISSALHPADEPTAFVKLLLEAAHQNKHPIYVVLTMRSDYLGDCAQFGGLPEAINQGLYLIPRMTRDQRREAITGPVAVGGGEIAPRLTNRLLNDVGDNPDQLPILQHALMRMWDCWRGDAATGPIDLSHYERVGTLSGALNQQADEAFAELTPRGQELAPKIFKRLTEKGGDNREVRRPATLGELVAVTGGTEAEIKAVIETFRAPGRSFLMPPNERSLELNSLIDISHESLIRGWSRLRGWVDEEAISAEQYSRLAETAELHQAGRAGLWRDPDLQLALDWRERNRPTPEWAARYSANFERALGFLAQSQQAREKEISATQHERWVRRRLRDAIIAVLAIGCIVSWIFSRQAHLARDRAEATKLIALARERDARSNALRVRKQSLGNKSLIATMASRLIDLTRAEEAQSWLLVKTGALSQLHKYNEAIQASEAILQSEPGNAQALSSIGYHYLLLGQPDKGLAYADAASKEDPMGWLNYQNRAIALAGLGRYSEAKSAMRKADEMFQIAGNELEDSEVSPEIEAATGVTVITGEESVVRSAGKLEIANLTAFEGGNDFAEKFTQASKEDYPFETYLTALNWCWLQMKYRPQDYGAYAAQGALWEQMKFETPAQQAFAHFEAEHQKRGDPRYAMLATWVKARRANEGGDRKLGDQKPDGPTLLFDAFEFQQRGESDDAEKRYNQAIQSEPANAEFALARAWFLLTRGDAAAGKGDPTAAKKFYEAAATDSVVVLSADARSARAYAARAFSKRGLKAPPAEIEADFRRALEYEPTFNGCLVALADQIRSDRPEEARALLERALNANADLPTLAWTYSLLAAIDQASGRLPEALSAIQSSIAIEGTDPSKYEMRTAIEHALGKTEAETNQELAKDFREVGNRAARSGNSSDAFIAYWRSLGLILAQKELPASAQDLKTLVEQISDTIQRLGPSERAAEFWQTMIDTNRLPALNTSAAMEIARLRTRTQPPQH